MATPLISFTIAHLLAGLALAAAPDPVQDPGPQPYRSQIQRLLAEPAPPRAESLPPARPYPAHYEEFMLRFLFEQEFLTPELEPILSEDGLEELRMALPGNLEQRLAAVVPAAVPLHYRLTLGSGAAPQVLLEGLEPVSPGQVAIFRAHRTRRAVVDFDVEIAQASFIADPITAPIRTGSSLAVALQPLPDGSFLGQVIARHSEEGKNQPIDLGYSAMDGCSRNPVRFEEAGTVMRLTPGQKQQLVLPGLQGRPFLLELEIPGTPVPQADDNLVFLPTLAHPPSGFMAPPSLGALSRLGYVECDVDTELPPSRLEAAIEAALPDGQAWEMIRLTESSGFIGLVGDGAARVASALRQQALSEARTRTVDLKVRVIGGDSPAEGKQLLHFRASVVVGVWSGFDAGEVRESVIDWDVEVAQGARVADPYFGAVEDGISGSLRLGDEDQVEVQLEIAKLNGFETRELRLGHPLFGATPDSALPMQPEENVKVEEPILSSMSLRGTYPLVATGAGRMLALRRSSAGLFGPGTTVELQLKVD